MKELTVEEKAKRYDLSLKAALTAYKDEDRHLKATLERMFPELKESEDERIRKAIHIYLDWLDGRKDYAPRGEYTIKDMISWLEKQGESTDINPSEFDLRLNKLLKQFETLPKEELANCLSFYLNVVQNDGTYKAEEKHGEQPRYSIGDVLCDKSCTTLNKDAQSNFEITDIRNGMYICDKCSFPISQQNEYELVAKKIEQKPAEWSEEDEYMLNETIQHLEELIRIDKAKHCSCDVQYYQRDIDWLKSLKDRVQPKQVWSEEDEQIILSIEQVMNCASLLNIVPEKIDKIKFWLKSIRPQSHWKPTKEQVEALHDLNLTGNISYAGQGQILIELYNDLKKLKE